MRLSVKSINYILSIFMLFIFGLFFLFSLLHDKSTIAIVDDFYEHPFKVSMAAVRMRSDFRTMWEISTSDVAGEVDTANTKLELKSLENDILAEMDVVKNRYLGPKEDIENVFNSYDQYRTLLHTAMDINEKKGNKEALKYLEENEAKEKLRELVENSSVIVNYAQNKAIFFRAKADSQLESYIYTSLVICLVVVGLFLAAAFFAMRYINKRFAEIHDALLQVDNGKLVDIEVRKYDIKEFADIKASIAQMAERLEGSYKTISEQAVELEVSLEQAREANERMMEQSREIEETNVELESVNEELSATNAAIRDQARELHESEDRLRESQQIAKIGSWTYFVEDDRFEVSDVASDIIGGFDEYYAAFSDAELLVREGDRKFFRDTFGAAITSKEPFYMTVATSSQEEPKYLSIRGKCVCDDTGKVASMVGTLQDITQIQKANELQNALINNNAMCIFLASQDRKIMKANERGCEMFGYDRTELEGADFSLIHTDMESFLAFANEYSKLRDGGLTNIRYRMRKKDGSIFWCSVSGAPLDTSDLSKGVIWTLLDIDDTVLLEGSYKDFFNSIQYSMYVLDLDKNFIEINSGFTAMHGFGAEEIIGKNVIEIIDCSKNDIEQINRYYDLAISGEPQTFEFWSVDKNGKSFPKEVSIARGKFVYKDAIVTIGLDITRQKQLEENLQTLVDEETRKRMEREHMLVQQSRLAIMGEMISNIAHQWRQPLNQISVLKDGLVDDYYFKDLNDAKMEHFNSSVTENLRYMSVTIDDFRNFFRPDKDKTEFSVVESINQAVSLVKDSMQSLDIDISKKFDSADMRIFGYQNEFAQAIINILSNARDALKANNDADNRQIEIGVHGQGGVVSITIQDNAGGIKSDVVDRIFDPYFTTKHKSQGTGLGLYMSKMIIEQNLGGKLTVANKNNGACFLIELAISKTGETNG